MAIFDSVSVQDLKRLLELFPLAAIKERWPDFKGTKLEICYQAAEQRDAGLIASFVDANIGCCKQHVYIFQPTDGQITFPDSLGDGELIVSRQNHALYLLCSRYTVVMKDPLEEATLDFLWPVMMDARAGYLILKFVVLEKNLSSYFQRSF